MSDILRRISFGLVLLALHTAAVAFVWANSTPFGTCMGGIMWLPIEMMDLPVTAVAYEFWEPRSTEAVGLTYLAGGGFQWFLTGAAAQAGWRLLSRGLTA